LIPIKTDVTIDKKVTHPELFQSIGVLLSQLVASFGVTDSKYAIGEAMVFFNWHPSSPKSRVDFHFFGSWDVWENCTVICCYVLKQATKDRITKQHASAMWMH
jgi:hypothetical protein